MGGGRDESNSSKTCFFSNIGQRERKREETEQVYSDRDEMINEETERTGYTGLISLV
jgi:hypothetical protein